jgi:hypothetical protein
MRSWSASCPAAPATKGRTWGSRNGSIWVSNGCRAEFVEARGGWGGGNGGGWGGNNGRPARPSAARARTTVSAVARSAGAMPAWSSCPAALAMKGRTWGVRNGAVWVSNGCRAEFAEARGWGGGGGGWGGGNSNYSITCSSNNNRSQNLRLG